MLMKAINSKTPSEINKYYYGTYKKTYKGWYNNHSATFRNKSKQKSTELSKHIWEPEGNTIQHQNQFGYSLKRSSLQWFHKEMHSMSDREISNCKVRSLFLT